MKVIYRHNNVSDAAFYVSNGMVFTDAEPEGARKWFPCWDKPSDKATLDLTAKTPSSVKLGSNGRLADSTTVGDTTWFHWVSRDPVSTYLVVMSAKVNYGLDIVHWRKISNPNDSIPLRFYYNIGENPTTMEQRVISMTTQFSTLFVEHPFEKNGFATLNSQFTWGGMENQTLTSLCTNCWNENLISHEYAHQWFGDMITCGTWADIWLNEVAQQAHRTPSRPRHAGGGRSGIVGRGAGCVPGETAMTELATELALVTGASRGIGRAIALELGRRGARVISKGGGQRSKLRFPSTLTMR